MLIREQFSVGIGQGKVAAGEFELFNSKDHSKLPTGSANETLRPGLSITMAIVYGCYDTLSLDRCPKSGCRSEKVFRHDSGSLVW